MMKAKKKSFQPSLWKKKKRKLCYHKIYCVCVFVCLYMGHTHNGMERKVSEELISIF